jgi:hypothetical protein
MDGGKSDGGGFSMLNRSAVSRLLLASGVAALLWAGVLWALS